MVDYNTLSGSNLEIKAQILEKGYTTSDYELTAYVIDPQGNSTPAPHGAIVTAVPTGGPVVSTTVANPFHSNKAGGEIWENFKENPANTLKVVWSGKYSILPLLFRLTFQKTALIKFPYILMREDTSIKTKGSGTISVRLSVPLDFPVTVSLHPNNLTLSSAALTLPANVTISTFTATAVPPRCPSNSQSGPYSCANDGYVGAAATPSGTSAPAFATASICVSIPCMQ